MSSLPFPFPRWLALAGVVSLGLSTFVSVTSAEDEYPRRKAEEFHLRGGIPNALKKLNEADGSEVRIAYLGGSITAAPGWRVKSLA